ncbi:16504_t:CDS:2 [Cetraspora pellucida]|uniref:16504_t:CDS:1 n=1 Tax=Cetraspora pellucida TaxID=1433469 RepID=A0A9N8VNB3_9GLOM|nr:16504_t:CDS:2 [Cetraspora pellucida]
MNNQNVYNDTQRKREKRKNKTPEQCEYQKRQKQENESGENNENNGIIDSGNEVNDDANNGVNDGANDGSNNGANDDVNDSANGVDGGINNGSEQVRQESGLKINEQEMQHTNIQEIQISTTIPVELLSAADISKLDRDLLRKFQTKMDKVKYMLCPICNESFLSIVLVMEECRRCYSEKTLPKKFSKENDMNSGEVLEELQGLTEIKEMLIAQVFLVMSVYKLHGGQYGYCGNVINFPQDVHEFTTHLLRSSSSLDVLVVRYQSARSESFRDFQVRHKKVARALMWLRENNQYYNEITIDESVLQSLPTNSYIDDQLTNNEIVAEESDNDEVKDDIITRTFVLSLSPVRREDAAINEALNHMQNESNPLL